MTSSNGATGIDPLQRLYRRWLRCYPARFRLAYGPGMEQTFAEKLHDERARGRRFGVPRLALKELADVVRTAVQERIGGVSCDVRITVRTLVRSPGFTAVAVLTLALGIGANTAIFSVVHGVVLRPLPYEDPDRLVSIFEVEPPGGWPMPLSPPNFYSLQEGTTALEGVVAYQLASATLRSDGGPERVPAMRVTAGFFELLGAPLALGRPFLAEEERGGAAPVVILSAQQWLGRFGGDRDVVGKMIVVDGTNRTIVGVAPRGFDLGDRGTQLWLPSELSARDLEGRGRHFLSVVGRLAPGVALGTATEELGALASRLALDYPESNQGWGMVARGLRDEVVGEARPALLLLLAAVGLVLLIACANVANLLLARGAARGREMAVRAAVGAGWARLLRQYITESLVLSGVGGVLGLVLAWGLTRVTLSTLASQLPRAGEVGIDGSVLAFTAIVTVLAGLVVGLVPAVQGGRGNLLATLRDGRLGAAQGRRPWRLRSILVVTEVALALVVVVAAGLLLNSFVRLIRVEPGFHAAGVLTARVSLPDARYPDRTQRTVFFLELVAGIGRLGSVRSAAAIEDVPFSGAHTTVIHLADSPEERVLALRHNATPGSFGTLGIPLLAGRDLALEDTAEAQTAVVVNETLARRVFPGEEALGRSFPWDGPDGPEELWVVGVAGDIKEGSLAAPTMPTMYLSNAQVQPRFSMALVLRTEEKPTSVVPALRSVLAGLDGQLPLYDVAPMEEIVDETLAPERCWLVLLGAFAAVALVLATVGVYGVLSYTVRERTQEVGIRVAVGAADSRVVALLVRQGMVLVAAGLALGTLAALASSRLLSGLLYQVSPTDPTTFVVVVGLIAGTGLAACYLPARRAVRIDPVRALRCE